MTNGSASALAAAPFGPLCQKSVPHSAGLRALIVAEAQCGGDPGVSHRISGPKAPCDDIFPSNVHNENQRLIQPCLDTVAKQDSPLDLVLSDLVSFNQSARTASLTAAYNPSAKQASYHESTCAGPAHPTLRNVLLPVRETKSTLHLQIDLPIASQRRPTYFVTISVSQIIQQPWVSIILFRRQWRVSSILPTHPAPSAYQQEN